MNSRLLISQTYAKSNTRLMTFSFPLQNPSKSNLREIFEFQVLIWNLQSRAFSLFSVKEKYISQLYKYLFKELIFLTKLFVISEHSFRETKDFLRNVFVKTTFDNCTICLNKARGIVSFVNYSNFKYVLFTLTHLNA